MHISKSNSEFRGSTVSSFEPQATNTEGASVRIRHMRTIDEAVNSVLLSEKFQTLLREVIRDVVTEVVDELIEEFDLDAKLSLRPEVADELKQLSQDSSSYIDEETLRRELGLDE